MYVLWLRNYAAMENSTHELVVTVATNLTFYYFLELQLLHNPLHSPVFFGLQYLNLSQIQ